MVDKIPKFQYVLISISDSKLKFKKKYTDIKYQYQNNVYYFGSDAEYAKFTQAFGDIERVNASLKELVDKCEYYYVDYPGLERIEEFIFSRKIIIVEK